MVQEGGFPGEMEGSSRALVGPSPLADRPEVLAEEKPSIGPGDYQLGDQEPDPGVVETLQSLDARDCRPRR